MSIEPNTFPKVSIITVCFNSETTIRDTLESVLSQDYPNIEYIIIDGGSTDKTLDVLKKYENRIRIINKSNSSFISTPNLEKPILQRGVHINENFNSQKEEKPRNYLFNLLN